RLHRHFEAGGNPLMQLAHRHHSSATEELQVVAPSKLAIDNVSKSFKGGSGSVLALDKVSLSVAEGEFVCLVGSSGCGKTTLLNMIAGLEKPDSGTVRADGRPVTGPGRERLVMFQEPALFPWLTVFGNVLFGLKLKPNLTKKDRHDVAKYYLELVGLSRFERANIHELSGGMKQRVSLARALAPNPRMLLMDEPFAALDALTREQLYGDLQRIWQARNETFSFRYAVLCCSPIDLGGAVPCKDLVACPRAFAAAGCSLFGRCCRGWNPGKSHDRYNAAVADRLYHWIACRTPIGAADGVFEAVARYDWHAGPRSTGAAECVLGPACAVVVRTDRGRYA